MQMMCWVSPVAAAGARESVMSPGTLVTLNSPSRVNVRDTLNSEQMAAVQLNASDLC